MLQGRRDFVFDNTQAIQAFTRLKGPKLLYLGDHGHAPSTFPAADTDYAMTLGRRWFDRFLKGRGERRGHRCQGAARTRPVEGEGGLVRRPAADDDADLSARRQGADARRRRTTSTRVAGRTKAKLEDFGAPTVTVAATATGGWNHLVAELVATTRTGEEIVVSGGAVRTSDGKRTTRSACSRRSRRFRPARPLA